MSGQEPRTARGAPVADADVQVVLVDESDRPVGVAPKLQAHVDGVLHRAFSVFLLDGRGKVLLQRRAAGKYHSAGLWSNTACGHPRPEEDTREAAARRLYEEMGVRCELVPAGAVVYRAEVGGGLVEHEYDHVFVGRFDGEPDPDPAEVSAWRWMPLDELRADRAANPGAYSAWLGPALERVR